MKRNIDLTTNRIFSNVTSIKEIIFLHRGCPWKKKNTHGTGDEFDLEHQRKSIIATGNRAKRAEIAEYRRMDSLNYCDCCGERMNMKPWDREFGICHKCNASFEKNRDRCLWRK